MTTCEILDAGMMHGFAERALAIVVAHEWIINFAPDSSWHTVECIECGASFANVQKDDPKLKHRDGCEVGAICAAYKRGPLTHYADNDSEECETNCEQTKARDIITNTRADVTCAECKGRNGIKP